MAEVAHAGQHHRDAALVGGCDDLVVTHRAARLDHACGAGIDDHVEAIAERKERVARHGRTAQRQAGVLGLDAGDAGRIAAEKSAGRARGGACASDAFFPFRDGLDAAADAGCTAVIQPGGSVRDQEVIDAANEYGMAMVFTSERHFRH